VGGGVAGGVAGGGGALGGLLLVEVAEVTLGAETARGADNAVTDAGSTRGLRCRLLEGDHGVGCVVTMAEAAALAVGTLDAVVAQFAHARRLRMAVSAEEAAACRGKAWAKRPVWVVVRANKGRTKVLGAAGSTVRVIEPAERAITQCVFLAHVAKNLA
jgi:hypothetical protein